MKPIEKFVPSETSQNEEPMNNVSHGRPASRDLKLRISVWSGFLIYDDCRFFRLINLCVCVRAHHVPACALQRSEEGWDEN